MQPVHAAEHLLHQLQRDIYFSDDILLPLITLYYGPISISYRRSKPKVLSYIHAMSTNFEKTIYDRDFVARTTKIEKSRVNQHQKYNKKKVFEKFLEAVLYTCS